MKADQLDEPEDRHQGILHEIKRALRRPKKVAPAPQILRSWAKSANKSRNKA